MTMEDIEWRRISDQAASRLARKEKAPPCKREDDHKFDSTGECMTCGAHRSPYRSS